MVVSMKTCKALMKAMLCVAMVAGAIAVAFEGRSQLIIGDGIVSYSRLYFLGSCRVMLRTVPASEVDCIDMRASGHLRGQGTREMLYVRLKNGVVFYNEREGRAYDTQLVTKMERALKEDGICVVRHFNSGFVVLALGLLAGVTWFSCAMFGKSRQAKDFVKRLWNCYPDSRPKNTKWDEW